MTATLERPAGGSTRRTLLGWLLTPALLVAVLVVVAVVLATRPLDSIEERRLNAGFIGQAALEHVTLTVVSSALVLLVAIPLGVLLTRRFARRVTGPSVAVFNIGQAVPSIGLLVLLAIGWGVGFWPAVVALLAYSTLPVLRNTMIGLSQVDPAVVEAGRGMGMSRFEVLRRIELPLAVPVILTGLRTALVINVGTATLAALTDAGGFGGIIITGLVQNRPLVTIIGSALTAVLALTIDYLGRVAEELLRPKGL